MKVQLSVLGALLLGACASNASMAAAGAAVTPPKPTSADSTRGRKMSNALHSGGGKPTLIRGSARMQYPVDAGVAKEQGNVIVAFIVTPNGRVDRESRTIIYLEGHPVFAKAVCDFLAEARFEIENPVAAGSMATMPSVFKIQGAPAHERSDARLDDVKEKLQLSLMVMDRSESERWLAARPSCSALKIRTDRY